MFEFNEYSITAVIIGFIFGTLLIPTSIMIHEIGHVLGIKIANKFLNAKVSYSAVLKIIPNFLTGSTKSNLDSVLIDNVVKHIFIKKMVYALGPIFHIFLFPCILLLGLLWSKYFDTTILFSCVFVLLVYAIGSFLLDKSEDCDRKIIFSKITKS